MGVNIVALLDAYDTLKTFRPFLSLYLFVRSHPVNPGAMLLSLRPSHLILLKRRNSECTRARYLTDVKGKPNGPAVIDKCITVMCHVT